MDLSKLKLNPPADPVAMVQAAGVFGGVMPAEYANFLAASDGGEGFVGETYIVLWKAGELDELNDDFNVAASAPGLVMFGTDGGEEGFAFDARGAVVMIPITAMDPATARPVGGSFREFLDRLAAGETDVPRN